MVDSDDVHVYELQYYFHPAKVLYQIGFDQISRLGRL